MFDDINKKYLNAQSMQNKTSSNQVVGRYSFLKANPTRIKNQKIDSDIANTGG